MKNKKTPMRSCIVSREKLPKSDLLRIVRGVDGQVIVDTTGKINGRGAYIKKDIEVLNKAIKTKALARALDTDIPESIYQEIEEIINK